MCYNYPQGVPAETIAEILPEEVSVLCLVVCNMLFVGFSQRRRIRRKEKLLEGLVSE